MVRRPMLLVDRVVGAILFVSLLLILLIPA
jgi:hypothetical protein